MMRQGTNTGRRPRGRTNRKQHGGGPSRPNTFDSNGPDGRVRGNARQVYEKYLSLARDATSAGDRVAAEAYFQYAEHYFRILSDSTDPMPSGRRQEERPPQHYGQDEGYDGDDESPVNGATGAPAERSREAGSGHPAAASSESREMQPRDGAPRDGRRVPAEAAPAVAEAQGGTPDGDASPARARRGRPRKPRPSEDGQARNQDPTPQTESDPAVG